MDRIEKARVAGKVNREAIEYGFNLAKPGVTLHEIDRELGEFISHHDDCTPAFKGYKGFPGNACLSVNEVAVHGVATDYVLKENDLLTVDIGTIYDGIYADAASTRFIERVEGLTLNLPYMVDEVLRRQLEVVQSGITLARIAMAGEEAAHFLRVSLVEDLGGHYIGEQLHMDPFVPNCFDHRKGKLSVDLQRKKYANHFLQEDDILCIEPVITIGPTELTIGPDGWTCSTQELSAHAEHMVLVTKNGYQILS